MRWFSGEILNSPDTRKPKAHFCQYYRSYQTYPYLSSVFMMLKTIKMLYEISKGCGYRLLQNYSRRLALSLATQNSSWQSVS